MSEAVVQELSDAIVQLDLKRVEEICRKAIGVGISPGKMMESMSQGMDIVGQKYEAREYFLAELIMAGEVMKTGLKVLEPYLKIEKGEKGRFLGKVVIGTVKGDLHDLGKDLAKTLLESAGFEVLDRGVDVSPEEFVKAVKEQKPDILAMSALLTVSLAEVENTINELKKAGLRNKVKIILGGAPVTVEFGKKIGADAVGVDAVQGVKICREWLSTKYI